MDTEVWKHLVDHEDILRLIVSRFSWDTYLRLRSVSKAFHATLSEPSFLTWSSMLNHKGFYADHPTLKWVDSFPTDTDHLKQSNADPVCLLRISQTSALVNFEIQRWCKLPSLGHLPFGDLGDFTVAGVAEGLLLLERKVLNLMVDLYELDRFLFNPLTKWFTKLPVVPKNTVDRMFNRLQYPMIMAVEKENSITVVATEFSHRHPRPDLDMAAIGALSRILIWRQSGEGWKPLEKIIPRITRIRSVDNAVFAGGDLFLHTKHLERGFSGNKVMSCERRVINPDMVSVSKFFSTPIFHLFQHRGVLKHLAGTSPAGIRGEGMELFTYDHMNGTWQEDEMTKMPKEMLDKLYATLPDGGTWRFFVILLSRHACPSP